jgi:hypothetical protein
MKTKSTASESGRGPPQVAYRAPTISACYWGMAVIPLACALLAGCGGGGDGGEPAPPPSITVPVAPRIEAASGGSDITDANYQAFAPALAQTVLTGMQSWYVGADIEIGASPMDAALLRQAARLVHPQTGREKALDSTTAQCPGGGTLTVIENGNSASLIYASCVLSDGTLVDGRIDDTINNANYDADGSPVAIDFNGTFTNLVQGTLATLNGPFHVAEVECSEDPTFHCGHKRISFNDTTATHGGQTAVLRLDVLQEHGLAQTVEFSGALGVGGQFYALTPKAGERFVVPSTGGPPSAGRMWMQDVAGDALEIKSQSSILVDFSFYPAGSATPSATWLGQPWSAFQ